MKRTTLIASTIVFGLSALAQQPYTPPYTESFEDGLGEFIAYDSNNDGNKIKANLNYGGGYDYSKGIYYVGTAESGADDWLFSPSLSLKSGMVYELTYYHKMPTSGKVNKVEWKVGTSADVSAMTISVGEPIVYEYTTGMFEKTTLKVIVPNDGVYYLGMHLYSDADQGTFYFDELKVAEGVESNKPEACSVTDPEFIVVGDKLNATMQIGVPTQTMGGLSLTDSSLSVRVYRSDRNGYDTLSAQAGSTITYVDEDASVQRVTYVVCCEVNDVEGVPVEVYSAPRMGTPKKVDGFNAEQEDNVFTLSWNPVVEPTNSSYLFIPAAVRYTIKCGSVVIAENTDKTSVTYSAPMPEQGQEPISFTVVATMGSNQSEMFTSPMYLIGAPLIGEFEESFANYSYANSGWTVENDAKNKWMPSVGSSYPVINPQDGDNGCLSFANDSGSELRIYSPKLDLSLLVNPMLKFWVYLQPSAYAAPSIQPGFVTSGVETLLGEPISLKSGDAEGWTEVSFELPSDAIENITQLVFNGVGAGSYNKMFIDNISILSYLDHNLALLSDVDIKQLQVGQNVSLPVKVTNKGVNSESEYSIKLIANDQEVAEVEGVLVEPSTSVMIDIPFVALPKYAKSDVEFRVVLDMSTDMDVADNECAFTLPVSGNELAVATCLIAESHNDGVDLKWIAPEVSTEPVYELVTESFEDWENGSVDPQNDWVFIDADSIAQKGLNNLNDNGKFAAMVIENFSGQYSWSLSVTAQDGTKCLAMTPAYSWGGVLDDWIISPMVKGGTEISFFTKIAYGYSATNTIDILWSAGGVSVEDFTLLESKIITNGDWVECKYELPADAKRFAIHFNAAMNGDAQLFDAFSYTAMTEPAIHTGYNLYRDDVLLATLDKSVLTYADTDLVEKEEHTYGITAVYDKGESLYSNLVVGMKTELTGIDIIDIESTENVEYYNLQGVKIISPQKGDVTIVRVGGKTYKSVVR